MKATCVLLLTLFVLGCGGGYRSGGGGGGGGALHIDTLVPNSATAGGPAFTLTVNGTGFTANSVAVLGNRRVVRIARKDIVLNQQNMRWECESHND